MDNFVGYSFDTLGSWFKMEVGVEEREYFPHNNQGEME